METSSTGTVNLRKYTVKESNNNSFIVIIAKFEFCITSVDHVWSTGGGCWNRADYVILIFGSRDQTHAFVKIE